MKRRGLAIVLVVLAVVALVRTCDEDEPMSPPLAPRPPSGKIDTVARPARSGPSATGDTAPSTETPRPHTVETSRILVVVDAATGEAVGGVVARARLPFGGRVDLNVTRGSDGRRTVYVGRAESNWTLDIGGTDYLFETLPLPVAGSVTRVGLTKGGVVRGFVVSGDGVGAVGAGVWAAGRATRAGVDGRFELAGLPFEIDLHLKAVFDGVRSNAERSVTLSKSDPSAEVRILVFERLSLTVRVEDEHGEPVVDAGVRCRSRRPEEWTEQGGRTATTGVAKVRGLPPGKYWIHATSRDHETAWLPSVFVERDGQTVTVVMLSRGRRWVGGVVRGPDGTLLEGVQVSTDVQAGKGGKIETVTGVDGRFRLDGLSRTSPSIVPGRSTLYPPQKRIVVCRASGWVTARTRVHLGTPATVVMGRAGEIQGRVLAPNGEPVETFELLYRADSGEVYLPEHGELRRNGSAGGVGRFSWKGVPGVPGQLLIQIPGRGGHHAVRVVPSAHPPTDLGDVVMAPTGAVEVLLRDAEGRHVTSFGSLDLVALHDGRMRRRSSFKPRPDGRMVTASTIPAGRYTVRADVQGLLSSSPASVTVTPGGTTVLEVDVRKAATLRIQAHGYADVSDEVLVTVRAQDVGRSWSPADPPATEPSVPEWTERLDEAGTAVFRNVVAGMLRVRAILDGVLLLDVEIELAPGEDRDFFVNLRPDRGRVKGK